MGFKAKAQRIESLMGPGPSQESLAVEGSAGGESLSSVMLSMLRCSCSSGWIAMSHLCAWQTGWSWLNSMGYKTKRHEGGMGTHWEWQVVLVWLRGGYQVLSV